MKLLFTLIILFPVFAFSQKKTSILPLNQSGEIIFTEVVPVDSTSAADLYTRGKLFVADAYLSNKGITELYDDASKTILIKASIKNHVKTLLVNEDYGYTSYQLKLECKDNRFRYTFSDFYHNGANYGNGKTPDGGNLNKQKGNNFTKGTWQQVQQQAYDHVQAVLRKLKANIQVKTNDF